MQVLLQMTVCNCLLFYACWFSLKYSRDLSYAVGTI
uniref:Uncharacterized protein n=1 Tax=Arundo donax TaxID=35708 RepID=A0A0A9FJI7_ARUDO